MLVPTPYYGAFKTDLMCRMGCVVYPIDLSSTPNADYEETTPFELSTARLNNTYQKAVSEGVKIRGIILMNPHNPLGSIYSKDQLVSYLQFADRLGLHVILDEIYLLSIFKEGVNMTTGLSLDGVINPDLLHIIWGFSKDFGLSGFRCGLVHTVNKAVANVVSSNAYFQSTPTISQFILQSLVSDYDWLDNVYLPTNQRLLREAHAFVKKELNEVGVALHEAVGGLYVWVDFRKFVRPLSRDGELKLMNMFLDHGVYITAGLAFNSSEFGWFRIIISVGKGLPAGINRIKKVLKEVADSPVEQDTGPDSLDDLVQNLQQQINGSQWLKENSAETWARENPKLAQQFQEEKAKSQ